MKYEVDNSMGIFLRLAGVVFAVGVVLGIVAPVYGAGSKLQLLLHLIIWVSELVGLASANGYLLKVVSKSEDGVVQYESRIPLVPVFMCRLVEMLYGLMRSKLLFSFTWWGVCLGVDVLFMFFLFFNKSKYYYESTEEE